MASSLWLRVKLIIGLVLVMIGVHIVNVLLGHQLGYYGIIPRSEPHWFHIFTSPFIHGNLGHLLNNLFGLAIFSAFCLLRSVSFYLVSSVFIITLTGVLVWMFGRDAVHIGASGWIFGLWSLSISIALFDRRLVNIVSGFMVFFFYGSMIYGVLPSDPNISFEAHLFGAVSGVFFAFFYSIFVKRTNNSGKSKRLSTRKTK
jgi:membrane associated rhomboid family serine protease